MMCVHYIGGCSIHKGRFHTSRGYYDEYIGDIMSMLGDVQYIRGYHEYIGRYHEYVGGCSGHWGFQ